MHTNRTLRTGSDRRGPKAAITDFLRVRFTDDPVGQVWNPAGVLWNSPSREPRHGQIGGAPEKMHRAACADEPGAKIFEDADSLDKDAPKACRVLCGVRAVNFVLVEAGPMRNLIGSP